MKIPLLILPLTITFATFGQGGSNIKYINSKEIGNELLNKEVKISFSSKYDRVGDTVELKITGSDIRLIEKNKRGVNYWYYDEQYLFSLNNLSGHTMKIFKSEIKKVANDSIQFTLFIESFNSDNNKVGTEAQDISLNRKSFNGVMLKK